MPRLSSSVYYDAELKVMTRISPATGSHAILNVPFHAVMQQRICLPCRPCGVVPRGGRTAGISKAVVQRVVRINMHSLRSGGVGCGQVPQSSEASRKKCRMSQPDFHAIPWSCVLHACCHTAYIQHVVSRVFSGLSHLRLSGQRCVRNMPSKYVQDSKIMI